MKLLILINGWSAKIISGGDYHILSVMRYWGTSHEISLVIPLLGRISCKPLLSDNYKIYLSSSESKGINSFMVVASYLKRIVKTVFLPFKDDPDVIICSSHLLYDTLPGFLLKLRFRAKLIVYVHHVISDQRQKGGGLLSRISRSGEKISLLLIRRANIVFVVNKDARDSLLKSGTQAGKIVLSSNGLNFKEIDFVKSMGDAIYDGCFCGRLVKTKGIYDLIDVWKLVTIRFPNAKMIVIGDGPEYTTFSDKIKEAKLDKNIRLVGFVSEQVKFLSMKQSKIFIFPSYEEGWGIAVSEAIACNLPVVVYDLRAYDVFRGCIIKVEKSNTQKMAEVIVRLIENENSIGKETLGYEVNKGDYFLDWEDVAINEMAGIRSVVRA